LRADDDEETRGAARVVLAAQQHQMIRAGIRCNHVGNLNCYQRRREAEDCKGGAPERNGRPPATAIRACQRRADNLQLCGMNPDHLVRLLDGGLGLIRDYHPHRDDREQGQAEDASCEGTTENRSVRQKHYSILWPPSHLSGRLRRQDLSVPEGRLLPRVQRIRRLPPDQWRQSLRAHRSAQPVQWLQSFPLPPPDR
jgi:hypothetical protein